jgi:UDP-N-acetylmuramoyl-L-alanyl-D-glutamate--2,6-diaminopimelate ligase
VVVCDQEPYDDDPDEIREQILIGVKKVEKVKPGVLHKVILNRREAIHEALRYGKKGDVVVITGLGCQPYRQMAGGKIKWDERKVVREELKKLKK